MSEHSETVSNDFHVFTKAPLVCGVDIENPDMQIDIGTRVRIIEIYDVDL